MAETVVGESPAQIRYVGFEHIQNARSFHFEVLTLGSARKLYTVRADLALFLRHQMAIQEGPALCARKLTFDLANGVAGGHELTADDIRAHLDRRKAEQAARIGTRKSRKDEAAAE